MAFRLPAHLFAQPPVIEYYRAHNIRSKPKDFVGEWPRLGVLYTGTRLRHPITGQPHLRVDGLHCEEPHSTFPLWRFRCLAVVWLN